MSVINTMLRDLEQRRHEVGAAGAYRYVRALPPARRGHALGVALGIGVLAALAAVVALGPDWWKTQARQPTSQVAVTRTSPGMSALPPSSTAVLAADGTGLSLSISREMRMPEAPARATVPLPDSGSPARSREATPSAPPPALVAAPRADAPVAPKSAAGERGYPPSAGAPALKPAGSLSERIAVAANPVTVPDAPIKQVNLQQRAENEFRRANELLGQGRSAQAAEVFAQIVASDPLHDAARQALVALHLGARNTAEAERVMVERQALVPKSTAFAIMLARLQAERGDNELALETLRASPPAAGSNAAYHASMAALLARQGQHAAAVTQYQTALRAAPNSGVWWMGLGLSLQAVGQIPEAQDALRRARASEGLSPELTAFVDQRLKQLQ